VISSAIFKKGGGNDKLNKTFSDFNYELEKEKAKAKEKEEKDNEKKQIRPQSLRIKKKNRGRIDDPFDPINVDIKQTKKRSSSTAEKKQNDNIERIPIVNIDSKDGVIVTDKNGEDEKKKSVSRVKTFQDKQKKIS